MNTLRLLIGDCVERMALLPEATIDVICCDPPYGLEFMGKRWDKLDGVGEGGAVFSTDGMGKGFKALPAFTGSSNPLCLNCKGSRRGRDRVGFKVCACDNPTFPNVGKVQGDKMQEWHLNWLVEALRVLVPGGVIKAFGGSRTYHRMAMAMEEAGFVDIHLEAWAYGSGFPKSLDVSKAIDKMKGLDRKVVGTKRGVRGADGTGHENAMPGKAVGVKQVACEVPVTAPTSPEAEAWDGWGTALKPAWEPILVGRKPV